MSLRELIGDVITAFRRNELANYASAIAFQVVFAIVPFLLFVLGLLGFLDLQEVWRKDVGPEIADSSSETAFRLIDETVRKVLTEKQVWWVTAGLALVIWELSGASRATMRALDRVYGLRRRRGFWELLPRSLLLGTAMGVCVVAAVTIVRFGPLLTGDLDRALAVLSFVARWLLAAAVLAVGVGLNVRYGAGTRQPLPWVSFGTALVLAGWVGMSIVFGLYVTYVASYGSVFGHLATFFVLLVYVYAGAVTFVIGVQVDVCVRDAEGRWMRRARAGAASRR